MRNNLKKRGITIDKITIIPSMIRHVNHKNSHLHICKYAYICAKPPEFMEF